ncbi:MAG: hypothetical protein ACLT1J_10485 [Mediterraneibacter gnavus]
MFTLTSQDRHGIAINRVKEATKQQGYDVAHEGDSINQFLFLIARQEEEESGNN